MEGVNSWWQLKGTLTFVWLFLIIPAMLLASCNGESLDLMFLSSCAGNIHDSRSTEKHLKAFCITNSIILQYWRLSDVSVLPSVALYENLSTSILWLPPPEEANFLLLMVGILLHCKSPKFFMRKCPGHATFIRWRKHFKASHGKLTSMNGG